MTQAEKTAIMQEYAIHEGDTGSPEVQIAVLRASQGASEGSSFAPRPSQDGRSQTQSPGIPSEG